MTLQQCRDNEETAHRVSESRIISKWQTAFQSLTWRPLSRVTRAQRSRSQWSWVQLRRRWVLLSSPGMVLTRLLAPSCATLRCGFSICRWKKNWLFVDRRMIRIGATFLMERKRLFAWPVEAAHLITRKFSLSGRIIFQMNLTLPDLAATRVLRPIFGLLPQSIYAPACWPTGKRWRLSCGPSPRLWRFHFHFRVIPLQIFLITRTPVSSGCCTIRRLEEMLSRDSCGPGRILMLV